MTFFKVVLFLAGVGAFGNGDKLLGFLFMAAAVGLAFLKDAQDEKEREERRNDIESAVKNALERRTRE